MDWPAIQDLCTFIDLYCLYDRLVVLRRGGGNTLPTWNSNFFGLLRDTNFVDVEEPDYNILRKVTSTASQHLITYLSDQESSVEKERRDRYEELLEFSLNWPGYILMQNPDEEQQVIDGNLWLQTAPSKASLVEMLLRESQGSRDVMFLIRTFLYLAYADVNKHAFSPDAVRGTILNQLLDKEEEFRGRLLRTIRGLGKDQLGDKEILSRVSPFASIVFAKAEKDKERIVPAMEELRKDLAGDRQRLLELENHALRGETFAEKEKRHKSG